MATIYDNYKLTNSMAVPQYEGSLAEPLERFGQVAQQRFDTAVEGIRRTGQHVMDTPALGSTGKAQWQALKQDIDKRLQEFSGREDKENIATDVTNYAMEVAGKMKPLADDYQSYAKWAEDEFKGKNLTPEQEDLMRAKALQDYDQSGGLKVDGYGRVIHRFSGPGVIKSQDRTQMIREAISLAHNNSTEVVQGTDDGVWKVKTGDKWTTLTPTQVMTAYENARRVRPEWQAQDEQEANLLHYKYTRNLNSKTADAYLDSLPALDKANIQKEIAKGGDKMQLISNTLRTNITNSILDAQRKYAGVAAYTDHSYSKVVDMNDSEAAERAKKRNEQPNITAAATTESKSGFKTFKDLEKAQTQVGANITSTLGQIASIKQQLTNTGISSTQKGNLQIKLNDLTATLNQLYQEKQKYDLVSKNAQDAYVVEKYGKTVDVLRAENKEKIKTLIEKESSPDTKYSIDNPKGNWASRNGTITHKEIMEAVKNGKATISANGDIEFADGRHVIPKTANAIRNISAIENDLDKGYKTKWKDPSIATQAINMPEKAWTEVKAFAASGILPLRSAEDNRLLESNELANVDWNAVNKEAVYNTTMNFIPIQLQDKEGKPLGYYKIDLKSTTARQKLGEIFSQEKFAPDIRQMGKDLTFNFSEHALTKLINNGEVGTSASGKPLKWLNEQGVEQNVKVTQDGLSYNLITTGGTPIGTTSSPAQAGEWLTTAEYYAENPDKLKPAATTPKKK